MFDDQKFLTCSVMAEIPSWLINLFVKKVGTSPRQYRIQHMSKAIDAVCKTDVPFIDTDVPEL